MNPAGSILLDTSVVIVHLRGDLSVTTHFNEVKVLYLSWIVVGELATARQYGLPIATRDRHFAFVKGVELIY